MRKPTTITAIVPLLLLVAASMASYSAHGQALPSRAFEIKSGSVEMQGGLLGFTDEVMLFMVVANRTGQTIWTEVAFRLPGSDKRLQEFEKIKSGRTQMYRWPVSKIAWDTEYPFTVSVFKDKKRKKPLGTEESFFFFEGDEDREVFEDLRRISVYSQRDAHQSPEHKRRVKPAVSEQTKPDTSRLTPNNPSRPGVR